MLALPRMYSVDHATSRESTARRRSHSTPAAAAEAWLAHALATSNLSPVGRRSTESGTAPRRLVRACSFERKVGQQRRGSNPNNSTCSMLQRSVSFGRKTPRSSGSGEGGQAGPLQLVPSVRHGPCYIPYRATFP